MKKIFLILILIQLFLPSIYAQTQDSDVQKLKQINQEVVEKYKAEKYDDALKAARQALDLSIKIYGAENNATAVSYTNLGEIYRVKRKNDAAAENLQKALAIYQKNPAQNKNVILIVLESLGTVLALDGKKEQAETFLMQYVSNTEMHYGKEGKEVIPALKSLGNFYIYTAQFDKADETFINRYLLTQKIFGKESDELDEIRDEHYCFTNQNFIAKDVTERRKKFEEALDKLLYPDKKEENNSQKKESNVINGTAIFLPKPAYPVEARNARAEGSVLVKVLIDEEGKVYKATAFCGNPLLRKASEEAAINAKFAPTRLNDLPVKVSGTIVYNFVH